MTEKETLGTRLQRLRKAFGPGKLSQGGLADLVHVARVTVGQWERDQAVPHPTHLAALAELFGVTLEYLRHGDEADPKEETGDISTILGGYQPLTSAGGSQPQMGFLRRQTPPPTEKISNNLDAVVTLTVRIPLSTELELRRRSDALDMTVAQYLEYLLKVTLPKEGEET